MLITSFAKTGLLIFMVPADICRPVVPLCFCSVLINTVSYLSLAVSWCNLFFILWQIATLLWVVSVELLRALTSLLSTLMDWIALGISQLQEGTRSMPHSRTLSWRTTLGFGPGAKVHKIVRMTMLRYNALMSDFMLEMWNMKI